MPSVQMSLHDVSPRIVSDYPQNGLSVSVKFWTDGPEMTMYFTDLHEWNNFRRAIPLADDYHCHQSGNAPSLTGSEAERFIESFFHEECVKRAKREADRLENINKAKTEADDSEATF